MIKPSEEAKDSEKKVPLRHTVTMDWTKKEKNIIRYSPFHYFQSFQQVENDEKKRKRKKKGLDHGPLVHRPQRIHFPSGPERNYIDRQNKKGKKGRRREEKYQRPSSFLCVCVCVSLNKRDVNTSNTYVRYVAFSLFLVFRNWYSVLYTDRSNQKRCGSI
jgi:hypothetical protein